MQWSLNLLCWSASHSPLILKGGGGGQWQLHTISKWNNRLTPACFIWMNNKLSQTNITLKLLWRLNAMEYSQAISHANMNWIPVTKGSW
jgi:hypothetical protein